MHLVLTFRHGYLHSGPVVKPHEDISRLLDKMVETRTSSHQMQTSPRLTINLIPKYLGSAVPLLSFSPLLSPDPLVPRFLFGCSARDITRVSKDSKVESKPPGYYRISMALPSCTASFLKKYLVNSENSDYRSPEREQPWK